MSHIRVTINPTKNIASVRGWIIAHKRKKNGGGAKRKVIVHDFDEGRFDPIDEKWMLLLRKATGNRIRRNYLQVVVFDQRGQKIDSIVRKLKD